MNSIDPLQLQRLIDGELSHEQIQKLIQEANTDPDSWQEIAVGFIEDQLWSKTVRANQSVELELSPPIEPVAPVKKDSEIRETKRSGISWLSIAASVLIAGVTGYFLNGLRADRPSNTVIADSVTPEINRVEKADWNPTHHLEVPEGDHQFGDLAGNIEPVPLFPVNNQEQVREFFTEKLQDAEPPKELVERMSRSGYQMKRNIELVSGTLKDGRTFVVPVRTIRFIPAQ